jgi:hypothetical protein
MQSTTTCCELCQACAAWHTATKQHNKKTKNKNHIKLDADFVLIINSFEK